MTFPPEHHVPTLSRREMLRLGAVSLAACFPGAKLFAEDDTFNFSRVTWRENEATIQADGRILVHASDGGIMFQQRDGQIELIQKQDLIETKDFPGTKFEPLQKNELAIELKKNFGAGFGTVFNGAHVICSNTNRLYADWVGDIFSRLQDGFTEFWKQDQLNFHAPEFPLPVIAFGERKEFAQYALKDADASTAVSNGYYSLATNRVALFDLTSLANQTQQLRSINDINKTMSFYQGDVSNVVHEAVHQLSFNCGLHQRYADNPLWLIEGLAMYCEIPDLSRRGWRMIGKPNKPRVAEFASYFKSNNRPEDSLLTLIRDDSRFATAESALIAYAEAWGLTYYLIEKRRDDYVAYLKHIAAKPVLKFLKPEERQAEFEQFFGTDWKELDEEMVALLKTIRR